MSTPSHSDILGFDVRTMSKAYLHRAGRTDRARAKGIAISLLTDVEARLIRRYQEELGIDLDGIRTRKGRVVPVE